MNSFNKGKTREVYLTKLFSLCELLCWGEGLEKKFSDMIQASARGSMILIVGKMLSTFISAVGTMIIARTLGSQSFGILNIALIPISIAFLVINNGTRSAIMKFLAEYRRDGDRQKIQEIIISGFTLNLTVGIVATLTVLLLSGFLANQVFRLPELALVIRILSISIFSQALLTTSTAVIIGFERMDQSILVQILYAIVKILIGPALVLLGFGVAGAAWGHSLAFLVAGCIGALFVYIYNRDLMLIRDFVKRETYQAIIVYSYPLFLAGLLTGGLHRLLDFLLSVNVSAEVMGNYSAAITFSVLVTLFMTPISTATFPLLSKLTLSDSVFKFVYQNIIKYESMIAFPITFAIIALSRHLVALLYGPTYTLAHIYLQVYMLNFLFIGAGNFVNLNLLNSQKETKITFYTTLIHILLGVPMGFFLIPRYGVLGYLITQLIAPKIGLLYNILWIRRNYKITPDYEIIVLIFTSSAIGFLVCTLFLYFFSMNPWVELFVGGAIMMAIYLGFLLGTGALTKENLEDIQGITKNYRILTVLNPLFKALIRIARE
jgi:O-antigen/teichoic acid export membrane protein